MKKILVLSILLVLVLAGVTAAQVGDPGTLEFFGFIGEESPIFTVTQATTHSNDTEIDLLTNAAVQPSGSGVLVGKWLFTARNQAEDVAYTVTYKYDPITQGGDSPAEIAYDLLVSDGATSITKANNGTTLFTATAGVSNNIFRNILVRLTPAGVTTASTAPANQDYNSTITITLTTTT